MNNGFQSKHFMIVAMIVALYQVKNRAVNDVKVNDCENEIV